MTSEKTTRVGVAMIPISTQGQILLGLRKSAHGEGTWSPAGGHVEFGEDPLEAATRELHEETGIVVTDANFMGYTSDFFIESGKHYVTISFGARVDANQKIKSGEPEKWAEWKWFYADELPENLFLPFANFVRKMGGKSGLRQMIAMAPRRAA
jgi:8-oxo-dGTP diphosphatase